MDFLKKQQDLERVGQRNYEHKKREAEQKDMHRQRN